MRMSACKLFDFLAALSVVACAVAVTGFLTGCCPNPWPLEDHRSWCVADSWHRNVPQGWNFVEIDCELVVVVRTERQGEAQAMLEHEGAVMLSPEAARRLAGRDIPGDGIPVLLRGVVLNEHSGGFTVGLRGRAAEVHHGCMGAGPRPMQRRAIIARIPRVPDDVYVTCSMVQ